MYNLIIGDLKLDSPLGECWLGGGGMQSAEMLSSAIPIHSICMIPHSDSKTTWKLKAQKAPNWVH